MVGEPRTLQPPRAGRLSVALTLAAIFLCADQVTKALARVAAVTGAFPMTVIPGVIDFSFTMNTGVAFGLASGYGYLFAVLALVVVIFSIAYLWRAPLVSWLEVVGLGMLVGGAVGNAIDRVVHGFVTDFIATTFIDFPVFNVADIGITVGVVIALIGFLAASPANRDLSERDQDSHPKA